MNWNESMTGGPMSATAHRAISRPLVTSSLVMVVLSHRTRNPSSGRSPPRTPESQSGERNATISSRTSIAAVAERAAHHPYVVTAAQPSALEGCVEYASIGPTRHRRHWVLRATLVAPRTAPLASRKRTKTRFVAGSKGTAVPVPWRKIPNVGVAPPAIVVTTLAPED